MPKLLYRAAPLLGVVVVGGLLRMTDISRAGYCVDEDITALAVQSIRDHGIPVLPSGAFYERGLPYTYSAWLAGAGFGHSVEVYRWPSWIFGLLTIVIAHWMASRIRGPQSALFASVLVCSSPLMIVVSQWARFYTMATFFFLLTVYLACAARTRPRLWMAFLASLFLSRLLHEMAVTLVVLPIFFYVSDDGDDSRRRNDLALFAGAVLVLGGIQLAVYGLHYWVSDPAMRLAQHHSEIHRTATFSLPLHPIVVGASPLAVGLVSLVVVALPWLFRRFGPLFELYLSATLLAGALFQLGALAFLALFFTIARPRRAAVAWATALVIGAGALLAWTTYASVVTHARFDLVLLGSMALGGVAHPIAALVYLARLWPILTATAILVTVTVYTSKSSLAPDNRELLGAAWCASAAVFLFLGIVRVGMRPRYFLDSIATAYICLPVLSTLFPALWRITPSIAKYGLALLVTVALVSEQRGALEQATIVTKAGSVWQISSHQFVEFPHRRWREAMGGLSQDKVTFCSDPLACFQAVGRADYWIATGKRDIAQFSVPIGAGRRDVYLGAHVLTSLDEVFLRIQEAVTDGPCLVLLADTGRNRSVDVEALRERLEAVPSLRATSERLPYLTVMRVEAVETIAEVLLPQGPP